MFGSASTSNLLRAIRDNNAELVRELVRDDERAVTQARGMRGQSALVEAVSFGSDEIVELLLAVLGSRGDVEAARMDGATALYIAVAGNRCSDRTVRLLLAHDADVCAASADGETVLDHACLNGRVAVVRMLLSAGAVPTVHSLARAAAGGAVDVLHELVRAGVDVNGVCDDGASPPIICAAQRLQHDAVLALLAHGADVDAQGRYTKSALLAAVRTLDYRGLALEHLQIVPLLLSAGAAVPHALWPRLSTLATASSRELLGRACFAVIRARAFQVLVALQDVGLPAWISLLILRAMGRNARLASLSCLWSLVTKVKHFHSSPA
jgi:ankyrin repeat protein